MPFKKCLVCCVLIGAFAPETALSAFAGKLTLSIPTSSIDEFREVVRLAKELKATHVGANQLVEPAIWMWNRNRTVSELGHEESDDFQVRRAGRDEGVDSR